jgi:HK97 family phage prohead protease
MRFYWPIAKIDAEERMVWGYASTEAVDEQGETVTRAALAAALDDYMRFANIREMHQNSAVGIAREATIDDRGLYLAAKIVDEEAWKKVVEGVYKGFSIGGRVTARDHADRRTITGLALNEISVVDRPANPEAVFDCWKRAASAAAGDMTQATRDPHDPLDYADPGYQPDGKQRYPLDSERHIRAAWAYIHQAHNAGRYTPGQLARIKSRIVAAWQAHIDAAGPPAAAAASAEPDTARKGLIELARLARLGVELAWLSDHIALEAALDGDASPSPDHLQEIIGALSDFIEARVAAASAGLIGGGKAPVAAPDFAAMARAGALRKAAARPPAPDLAPLATGLARLADQLVPRLDALQKRVDDIAATPLPPQAAARGFAGLTKRDDGFGGLATDGDIVAALARMTDEERTLTLIKAAHATPITASGGYRR